jgi:hypothetical protein
MKREQILTPVIVVAVLMGAGCREVGEGRGRDESPAVAVASQATALNIDALRKVLGGEGLVDGAEWKFTVPQNDLSVVVDGFRIIPPMGLASWATFAPAPGGAVVMGDLVLKEEEVGQVQTVVLAQGLTITALHKHFLRESPRVVYLHFAGRGSEAVLGAAVRSVLDRVAQLRGRDPGGATAVEVSNTMDVGRIAEILGHRGTLERGVYKVTIGRPDVSLRDHGATVSSFGGFNTWAAFQGTAERAAVAGDFAMLADEVDGVLRALVEHGIEVVGLHNHMVHEEPRVLFLHYWGVGPAERLAQGLRAALDRTARPRI